MAIPEPGNSPCFGGSAILDKIAKGFQITTKQKLRPGAQESQKSKSSIISFRCICNWGNYTYQGMEIPVCEFMFNQFQTHLEDGHPWKNQLIKFTTGTTLAFKAAVFEIFKEEESENGLQLQKEIDFLSSMRFYAEEALQSQVYLDKCNDSFLRSSNRGRLTLVDEQYFHFGVMLMKKVSASVDQEKLGNDPDVTANAKDDILKNDELLGIFLDCCKGNVYLGKLSEKKKIFAEFVDKMINARFSEEIRAYREEHAARGTKYKGTNLTMREEIDKQTGEEILNAPKAYNTLLTLTAISYSGVLLLAYIGGNWTEAILQIKCRLLNPAMVLGLVVLTLTVYYSHFPTEEYIAVLNNNWKAIAIQDDKETNLCGSFSDVPILVALEPSIRKKQRKNDYNPNEHQRTMLPVSIVVDIPGLQAAAPWDFGSNVILMSIGALVYNNSSRKSLVWFCPEGTVKLGAFAYTAIIAVLANQCLHNLALVFTNHIDLIFKIPPLPDNHVSLFIPMPSRPPGGTHWRLGIHILTVFMVGFKRISGHDKMSRDSCLFEALDQEEHTILTRDNIIIQEAAQMSGNVMFPHTWLLLVNDDNDQHHWVYSSKWCYLYLSPITAGYRKKKVTKKKKTHCLLQDKQRRQESLKKKEDANEKLGLTNTPNSPLSSGLVPEMLNNWFMYDPSIELAEHDVLICHELNDSNSVSDDDCFAHNYEDDEEEIDSKVPLPPPLSSVKHGNDNSNCCKACIRQTEEANFFKDKRKSYITRARVMKIIYATGPAMEGYGFEPNLLIDWCYEKLISVDEENLFPPHAEDPTLPTSHPELQGNIDIMNSTIRCNKDSNEILVPTILYMDGIAVDNGGTKLIDNVNNLHSGLCETILSSKDACDQTDVTYFIGDTPQHDQLCGHCQTTNIKMICRHCNCLRTLGNNACVNVLKGPVSIKSGKMKVSKDNNGEEYDSVHLWMMFNFTDHIPTGEEGVNVEQYFKNLSHHHVHDGNVSFYDLDFGENAHNIHLASPGEMFHMNQLGCVNRAVREQSSGDIL
eukprot:jgi/Psemu1/17706/gm1.17706_g